MISLRGLTDHTLTSYSTYISAYLGYLSDILGKAPEDVFWAELRDFIRWFQNEQQLSDRTSSHSRSLIPVCPSSPPVILRYWYSLPVKERPRDFLFTQKRDSSKPVDHQRVPDYIRFHEGKLGWEAPFYLPYFPARFCHLSL